MKTLMFATSYVNSLDKVFILDTWVRSGQQQDSNLLIVDSASPFQFPIQSKKLSIHQFGNSIGHNGNPGQRDGWGGAFCKGIELAIEGGYDYVYHLEGDVSCRVDVRDIITLMQRAGKKVAAPYCAQVSAIETGLMVMDVAFLKSIDFVKRYNWETLVYPEHCEDRVQNLVKDVWLRLEWEGGRLENQLEAENSFLARRPHVRYVTHCRSAIHDLLMRDHKGNILPLEKLVDAT